MHSSGAASTQRGLAASGRELPLPPVREVC
jgi:hypothetical protein